MATPEKLLEEVSDFESFIAFLNALIEDRADAEKLEAKEPARWAYGGAQGWQNADISAFMECGMQYFVRHKEEMKTRQPSWKDIAEFLYFGKIYE